MNASTTPSSPVSSPVSSTVFPVIDTWRPVLEHAATGDRHVLVRDAHGNRFVLLSEERYEALVGQQGAAPAARRVRLTGRELEVLRLAGLGHPATAIAGTLGIAQNTVAQHLVAVRRKYGVGSTAAAASLARRQGLI